MTVFRVVPLAGAPCLRHAGSIARATTRALVEFPAGLRSVKPVGIAELAELASSGLSLPVEARQRVAAYNAVRQERARVARHRVKVREAACERREQKALEEANRRAELREQERARRRVEKQRKEAAERREKRQQQKQAAEQQQAAQQAVRPVSVAIPAADETRPPWED